LGALFSRAGVTDPGEDSSVEPVTGGSRGEDAGGRSENGRPLAILRCGGGSVVVGFDRIVWRENARLTALPPRLCPVEEVLGGIVSPDSSVILVLNPSALVRKLKPVEPPAEGQVQ
jgi:hypothetical protein